MLYWVFQFKGAQRKLFPKCIICNRKKKTLVKHFFEFFNFDEEKKVFRTVRMIMTKIPAPI